MSQFRLKSATIEAVVYQRGMEDGFDTGNEVHRFISMGMYVVSTIHGRYRVYPYIRNWRGKDYIEDGDYIVTGMSGNRWPCRREVLDLYYEPVDREEGSSNGAMRAPRSQRLPDDRMQPGESAEAEMPLVRRASRLLMRRPARRGSVRPANMQEAPQEPGTG